MSIWLNTEQQGLQLAHDGLELIEHHLCRHLARLSLQASDDSMSSANSTQLSTHRIRLPWSRRALGQAQRVADLMVSRRSEKAAAGDRSAAAKRAATPWAKRQAAMADYQDYVCRKMHDYCPWQRWV